MVTLSSNKIKGRKVSALEPFVKTPHRRVFDMEGVQKQKVTLGSFEKKRRKKRCGEVYTCVKRQLSHGS